MHPGKASDFCIRWSSLPRVCAQWLCALSLLCCEPAAVLNDAAAAPPTADAGAEAGAIDASRDASAPEAALDAAGHDAAGHDAASHDATAPRDAARDAAAAEAAVDATDDDAHRADGAVRDAGPGDAHRDAAVADASGGDLQAADTAHPDVQISPDSGPPPTYSYDVVVVGAGTGGVAAALQAARLGASVALVEESDWVGGQMTAAAVSTMDEGGFNDDAGLYIELWGQVLDHYAALGKSPEDCGIRGGGRGVEVFVAQAILLDMIAAQPTIDLYLRTRPVAVLSELRAGRTTVWGVDLERRDVGAPAPLRLESHVLIDATEYGDVIGMSPARYRVGNVTSDAIDPGRCVQDITYTTVLKRYRDGVPAALVLPGPPPGYDATVEAHFASIVTSDGHDWRSYPWGTYPVNWLTHVAYRSVPNSFDAEDYVDLDYDKISRSGVNWANDFDYSVAALEDRAVRRAQSCAAKLRTLQFLYYAQAVLGETSWAVADDQGFDTPFHQASLCDEIPQAFKAIERHFPVMPYVRESRRLIGIDTLTAADIRRQGSPPRAARLYRTSLAVGDYAVDLHDCTGDANLELELETWSDVPSSWAAGPFQIPFEVFVPAEVDGLLAAEKNLSYSRLASGASRLQPVTMHTGQAAGVLAALAAARGEQPRLLEPLRVQLALVAAGCRLSPYKFSDVPLSHARWSEVELVATRQIMIGYGDGSFGAADDMTRAQAAVVVARLFELDTSSPPPTPSFTDVPSGHFAYAAIEALYAAGITGGCRSVPLEFCPDEPVTRAHLAIFIARGLGLDPQSAPSTPFYEDVPPGHVAFTAVQGLTELGVVNGCTVTPPGFCPDAAATRIQAATMAARTLAAQLD